MSGTTQKEAAMDRYLVEVEWKTRNPLPQQPVREKYGILTGTSINWRSLVEADDEKLEKMRADNAFSLVRIIKKL